MEALRKVGGFRKYFLLSTIFNGSRFNILKVPKSELKLSFACRLPPRPVNPQSLAQTGSEMSVLALSFLYSILISWYIIKAVAPGRAKIQNPKSSNSELIQITNN